MKNRILVIGGTGTVGSAVVAELKQNNADYVVLTRNKEKAEELIANDTPTVVGTLGDETAIEDVFENVNTIFLVTSPAENMLDIHKEAINMAVKKGIKKIVRLSAEPVNYNKGLFMYEQHAEADKYLQQSGLEYVILRPHYFMQNLMMHIESVKSQNMFAQYSGDAKIPMIDVRDIAKAAFQTLIKDDFNGQALVLSGPSSISYSDIANSLSSALGRTIEYTDLPYEVQKENFKSYGLPNWQLNSVMKLFKTWEDKNYLKPSRDIELITNSKPISIDEFLKDHTILFK